MVPVNPQAVFTLNDEVSSNSFAITLSVPSGQEGRQSIAVLSAALSGLAGTGGSSFFRVQLGGVTIYMAEGFKTSDGADLQGLCPFVAAEKGGNVVITAGSSQWTSGYLTVTYVLIG